MRRFICFFILFLFAFSAFGIPALGEEQTLSVSDALAALDNLADTAVKKTGTPGISAAIVSENGVEFKSYGYANLSAGETVSPDTLFELGSMSKAFTGLGIILLEQEGKLKLTDEITQYIPWLKLYYKGEYKGKKINGEVPVTVGNVLYQTTGLPFKTIGYIPEGNSDDMLEKTVRTLTGTYLSFYPGTQHSYATINYDILGLIIQTVSGESYEEFIKNEILIPLGLHNTYMTRAEAVATGNMATGYKTEFFQVREYAAPEYRGNTPAGYVISSARDMARWMGIQMGIIGIPEKYRTAVERSHVGNMTVASSGDSYYAAGWSVHIRGEYISHAGSNPNFSSNLTIDNEKQIGICVLANLNSNVPGYITENFFNTIYNRGFTKLGQDTYKTMDTTFSCICIGSVLVGAFFFVMCIIAVIEILQKKRIREKFKGAKLAGLLVAIPIMIFYGFCIYYLPNILLERLPWDAVVVWGSRSILCGAVCGFFAGIIFFIYVLITFNYLKPKEKNYPALVPLSLINGLTSTLIIFTINESFNRNLEYSKELLVYFIFSLLFFVYTNKLFEGRMILITNEISYEKRMSMIDKVIHSSYQAIEKIGSARIYSGLNNDVGVVAGIPGMVVGFATNLLTFLFCLYYLLSNSVVAFAASTCILALNSLMGFITSRLSAKYWEKHRDIQDIYFDQMADLVYGFKELVLSKLRKLAFYKDIKKYSRLSTDLSKEAGVKFLNFGVYHSLMYNLIFGIVVFIFPLIILDINANELRETLFMVFYMIGPFGAITGIIPNITSLRVHLKRINKLIEDLEEVSTGYSKQKAMVTVTPPVTLQVENVVYSYTMRDEETEEESIEFTLGPVNLRFSTGEITYITGGNGSGKSTLGKILSGLYAPASGEILLNGEKCNMVDLNECFTAVYSDFHLFKKLYGVDVSKQDREIRELLHHLRLDHKVELDEEGAFHSLNLSTGQRKRLAYVVCCLDDKPFILLDEWAAEQDPEFRQYFYTELLPQLKKQGKGVVVISHDDRYFYLADNMIKLERGVVV